MARVEKNCNNLKGDIHQISSEIQWDSEFIFEIFLKFTLKSSKVCIRSLKILNKQNNVSL